MESLLELGDFLWPLPDIALSETQIKSYGKYLLLLASSFYLSVSLKSAVPADTRHAIEAHLPQGFDRSIVDARLQQRRSKELLQQCLQLAEQRDRLRRETDREAKLRGWNEVFRLNLVGIVAAAYTHSLTMSLFAVKNTVRVLVFLLRQREEARLQQKQSKNEDSNSNSGPLLKVKTWWAGGMQSLLTSVLISQLSKKAQRQQQQGSPFATVGVGEDLPLPVPPCALNGTVEDANAATAACGGGGNGNNGTTGQYTPQRPPPPPPPHHAHHHHKHSHEAKAQRAQGPYPPSPSLTHRRRQRREQEEYLETMMAEAERAFSVKTVLEAAVPAVVECASRVVSFALSRRPAHMFNAASVISEKELRALLQDIASQFEREACVAEWVQRSSAAVYTNTTTGAMWPNATGRTAFTNSSMTSGSTSTAPPPPPPPLAGLATQSNIVSTNTSIALNSNREGNTNLCDAQQQTPQQNTMRTANTTSNPSARTSASPPPTTNTHTTTGTSTSTTTTTTTTTSSSDEDIIDFPAGSTVMIGPDGQPIRRTHAHNTTMTNSHTNSNINMTMMMGGEEVEMDIETFFAADGLETAEERAAHLEALRREQLLKQLSATYFQKVIHSASFAELCLSYAAELLERTIAEASCLRTVKSYDRATRTARMLMVIPALDVHRQHLFDADFAVQPYLKLFCEEMVRSTCS